MKMINELSVKKLNSLKRLILAAGFEIIKETPHVIIIEKGFRSFSIYSTDILDIENGLKTNFNLHDFVNSTFKSKPKHTIALKNRVNSNWANVEEAFGDLNWEVFKSYSPLTMFQEIEDPFADILYEVLIRDLNHVVIDGEVFEGNITPLIEISKITAKECLTYLDGSKVLDFLNKENQ